MDKIQKAYNIGDEKVAKDGFTYYVSAFNAKGVPLWKKKKDGSKPAQTTQPSGSATQKPASQPSKTTAQAQTTAKKEDSDSTYKKPKAKVKYSFMPSVEIDVPETWNVKDATGKIKTAHRDKLIALFETKTDEDLLKIVNGTNYSKYNRQLAFDIAAARGIPENKIDVSGTLKKYWNSIENTAKLTQVQKIDEDAQEDYADNLKGFDVAAFMEQFPNGDEGWRDKNDPRVQKEFNKLNTLVDRQKYDAFLDYQKRQDPNYLSPDATLKNLNKKYLGFLVSKSSLLLVASGGAGVGKTWGFKKIAEEIGLERYDPKNPDKPYDWVVAPNIKSEADLRSVLTKHNGKTILFDDNDNILTRKDCQPIMKTVADTSPDSRLFRERTEEGKDGDMINFTGKICILTNKSSDNLIKAAGEGAEDVKAVLSRAKKADVNFTVQENLDILKQRYKTMEIDGLSIDASDEAKMRDEVFQFILDNSDRLDPAKFTVRKFSELMKAVEDDYITQKYSKGSSVIKKLTGGDDSLGWKRTAWEELNKADDSESFDEEFSAEDRKKTEKMMKKIKHKNPKLYGELFGEDEEEKVAKAMFSDMSLESAEELLFG